MSSLVRQRVAFFAPTQRGNPGRTREEHRAACGQRHGGDLIRRDVQFQVELYALDAKCRARERRRQTTFAQHVNVDPKNCESALPGDFRAGAECKIFITVHTDGKKITTYRICIVDNNLVDPARLVINSYSGLALDIGED
ncbi:hypothetical protein ACOTTU_13445 [Roseobacter sp. EG26]